MPRQHRSMKNQPELRPVTLEEVERSLPAVEKALLELQALQMAIDVLDSIEFEVDEEEDFRAEPSITRLNREFHRLSYHFYRKLERLQKYGCIVKDLDTGLVDFLALFEGREVFLCWQLGESTIRHWHEVDEGFAGRQQILGR